MIIRTLKELVTIVNNDLGAVFCNMFRYKRKELGKHGRASSSGILFKLVDQTRDWVINEGGGTEIQYHLFYRQNEIGYGLGFNAQYVPFANSKSPVDYIRPFVNSIIRLKNANDSRIALLEQKGFSIIDGNWDELKNIKAGDYFLFGKIIPIKNGAIQDEKYKEMVTCIKTNLYDLYVAIWEEKLKHNLIVNNMKTYTKLAYSNKNLILTGAPGTGKTYLAKQIAQQMIFGETKEKMNDDEEKQFEEQLGFVQFHPSYDYTDFVEGLRPLQDKNGNLGFERKDGVFKDFCIKALKNPNKNYVMIIDEINRGEISKIFGELFFSIDLGYRGKDGKVRTQYSSMQTTPNEFDTLLGITESNNCGHFFVPKNVYIIGTMNDIDRSVESMDFAFRRRFAFKEITAKDSQKMLDSDEAWGKDNNGVSRKPNEEELKIIKEKMDALNNLICPEKKNGGSEEGIDGLSSAYHIGASYFLKLVNYKKDDGTYDYDQLWDNHLEGLLLEYMRGMTDVSEKTKTLAIAFGYSKMEKYE